MFNSLFIQPLFNLLVFLYQSVTFNDLGLAIIILTIIIRLILLPLFYKGFRSQAILQKIQPEIQKIQNDHRHNREEQARAMLALYQQHRVNPFSGFLLILVQLPVLIALYQVFLKGLSSEAFKNLYSFIPQPTSIDTLFLGLIDLAKPSIIILVLAALAQYVQGRLSLPPTVGADNSQNPAVRVAKQMVYIGPILTIVVLYSLPSAIGIYWLATTIFSIAQQIYINKKVYGTN